MVGFQKVEPGDGQQTKDFVSVNATESSSSPAAYVFNVASGKSISINELAKTMIRISGLDLEPLYEEERKGDIKYVAADTTISKSILGFFPKRSWSLD